MIDHMNERHMKKTEKKILDKEEEEDLLHSPQTAILRQEENKP
jgi:hypothetical protein